MKSWYYIYFNFSKRKQDENDYRIVKKQTTDSSEYIGEYKPRTQETRQSYEILLATIQDALGDQVRFFKTFIVSLLAKKDDALV